MPGAVARLGVLLPLRTVEHAHGDPTGGGDLLLDLRASPCGESTLEPGPVPDPVELLQRSGVMGMVTVQAHPSVGGAGEAGELRPALHGVPVDAQVLECREGGDDERGARRRAEVEVAGARESSGGGTDPLHDVGRQRPDVEGTGPPAGGGVHARQATLRPPPRQPSPSLAAQS